MKTQIRRRGGMARRAEMAPNELKKTQQAAGAGVNGPKWTHTKQMKTQIRRRVGMAPPGAWGK